MSSHKSSVEDVTDPNNFSFEGPRTLVDSVLSLSNDEGGPMLKVNDSYENWTYQL